MRAYFCNNFVGTKVPVGKLLGRLSSLDILGTYKDFLTKLEIQGWFASGIHRDLVTLLSISQVFPEVLMKLIKVSNKGVGSRRGEFPLRMNGNVRVITLVSEEWRGTSRFIRSVVVGELCQRQERTPIVLLIIAINA